MDQHLNKTINFSAFYNSSKTRLHLKDNRTNSTSSIKPNKKRLYSKIPLQDTHSSSFNTLDPEIKGQVTRSNKVLQDFFNNTLKNLQDDKKEYSEIVNTCLKLEEVVDLYEKKNAKMKLRIEELEKENAYLGNKLKMYWKKNPDELKEKKARQENCEQEKFQLKKKGEGLYVPTTSSGKYLKGLGDKYGAGTKEFYREIEGFLDYREHKLNMSIGHYKSIIGNLQAKLKKKNSEYLNGMTIGSVGTFFLECVEDVRKVLVEKRNDARVLTSDKLRILKRFLLDEGILRMVYGKLVEDQEVQAGDKHDEVVLYKGIGETCMLYPSH